MCSIWFNYIYWRLIIICMGYLVKYSFLRDSWIFYCHSSFCIFLTPNHSLVNRKSRIQWIERRKVFFSYLLLAGMLLFYQSNRLYNRMDFHIILSLLSRVAINGSFVQKKQQKKGNNNKMLKFNICRTYIDFCFVHFQIIFYSVYKQYVYTNIK